MSGKPPIKSAAEYDWGVPSQATLGGSGASAATGGVAPRQNYFSAECWGTGVALAQTNPDLPLGLIVAARGGAAIQSFMSKEAVAECPRVSIVNPPHFGGVSAWWTGMMEPMRYIRPSGFVWHQGEENSGQPNDCAWRPLVNAALDNLTQPSPLSIISHEYMAISRGTESFAAPQWID